MGGECCSINAVLAKSPRLVNDRKLGGERWYHKSRERMQLLTVETLIWFVVRVPVLSEQMTLVLPRVSTLGRFRTMAFFWAIFLVPRARHAVMTAANPSGMAATVIHCALEGTVMCGIPEVPNVDEPHEDADDRNDLCEHVTEVVQLTLQGGLFADL